ncbi:MAG: DNA repair protein RadC [Clostridia bacterium]|nr:DNA repair protein RadC [Clostridia bacterium]
MVHEGHRNRLREKFRRAGVEGFADHEMLELLLFNSIPRANTNDTAHLLMEHFGSITAVLEADERQLMSIKGIGPRSAHLIKLIGAFTRLYIARKHEVGNVLDTKDKVVDFMLPYYIGAVNEIFYLITLDNSLQLINCTKISEGTPNSVDINIRRVVEVAIKDNASSVILVHNHLVGGSFPSEADINTTVQLVSTMKSIGLKVIDHVIVVLNGECTSLATYAGYQYIFK